MRSLFGALPLLCALACVGCFDLATVLRVNGDGSGTLTVRTVFTDAALAQIRQLATLGGSNQAFDPTSEEQARADAARIGPGVTYVSSVPVKTSTGMGRESTYSFVDVSQVKLMQQPGLPGGVSVGGPAAASAAQSVTLSLQRQPDGDAVLHIATGVRRPPAADGTPAAGARGLFGDPPPEQLAMVKQMLAGARVLIAVEPIGRVVKTTSPYVDGNRVTLLQVDLDVLLTEQMLERLRSGSEADIRAAMADAPSLKIPLDPEITIEFTPSK